MPDYESLLLGGAKPKRKVSKATLDALARGRATRAANLAAGKKQCGKGQYNQDYVDESQINYAGSPLDMYYLQPPADRAKERAERGEVGKGARRGRGIDEELTSKAGGKIKRRKSAPSGRTETAKEFMEHSLHTGMDMPTEAQMKRGGKLKKQHLKAPTARDLEEDDEMEYTGKGRVRKSVAVKKAPVGRKRVSVEDIEGGALNIDVPEAIRVLGELASKFGLKLAK